ncbi:MAG: hypothetical protein ACW963_01905 [Candidatus Sifarchaeia archaeon]|jgi:hypothetical protein
MLSKEEATKIANQAEIGVYKDSVYGYVIEFLPKEVVQSLFARSATHRITAETSEELCSKLESILMSLEEIENEEGDFVFPNKKEGFVLGSFSGRGVRPIPFAENNIENTKAEIMFLIDCLS